MNRCREGCRLCCPELVDDDEDCGMAAALAFLVACMLVGAAVIWFVTRGLPWLLVELMGGRG